MIISDKRTKNLTKHLKKKKKIRQILLCNYVKDGTVFIIFHFYYFYFNKYP